MLLYNQLYEYKKKQLQFITNAALDDTRVGASKDPMFRWFFQLNIPYMQHNNHLNIGCYHVSTLATSTNGLVIECNIF